MIDTTLPSLLLPEQPTTELQLLQSISKLKESAESLKFEREATITISRHETMWWLLMILSIIASSIIVVILWKFTIHCRSDIMNAIRKHLYRPVRRQSISIRDPKQTEDEESELETSLGPSESN